MYDIIVIGARCAGSPTAMLLARSGYRVLLVDRASFPSDAVSTHYLHYPAVTRLKRWGLFDSVVASGAPLIDRITWAMKEVQFTGTAPEWEGTRIGIAPRRLVLDKILVDAAVAAGAQLREGTTVTEILTDGDRAIGIRCRDRVGRTFTEHAEMVIGADGFHSIVAETFKPAEWESTPPMTANWYTYWRGTDIDHLMINRLDGREVVMVPTNDDCINVMVGWRQSEFQEFRQDVEGNYLATLDLFPEMGARIRAGRRVEPIYGSRRTRQWIRHPYGPGWALVGDAMYHKDPLSASGISDAFRSAEVLAAAIDAGLSGRARLAQALAGYHSWSEESFRDVFQYYRRAATLDALPPPVLEVLDALQFDQDASDRFLGILGGFTSFSGFFQPENTGPILARAAAAKAALAQEAAHVAAAGTGAPAVGVGAGGGGASGSAWTGWLPGDGQ